MIYPLSKPISADEFVAWYPERSQTQYELHQGVIVEMPPPTGEHEEIIAFLIAQLILEINRLKRPWIALESRLVKVGTDTSYCPDILVLNRENLGAEPLWKQASTITQAQSICLAIEVVSTNWRDDYLKKLGDYESFGIPEYWIVDYLALGAKRYTGSPKRPIISICSLADGEYQITQFKEDDLIQSPTFPELNLTAAQIFANGSNSY